MTSGISITRPLSTAALTGCIMSAWAIAWAFFVPFDAVTFVFFGIPYSFLLAFTVVGIFLCKRPLLVYLSLGACMVFSLGVLWIIVGRPIDPNNLDLFTTVAAIPVYAAVALSLAAAVAGWVTFMVRRSA
jgi:hypothetical protein